MAALSLAERSVVLVWSYSVAINDGGHASFFYNSYAEHAHETVQALNEVGASEYAAILKRAIDLFPGGHIPRSVDERNALLESLPEEADQVMETLDDDFQALGDAELMDRLLKFWNNADAQNS